MALVYHPKQAKLKLMFDAVHTILANTRMNENLYS